MTIINLPIINDLLKCKDLICMYEFGSTVYKSNDFYSDIDFIIVMDDTSIYKSVITDDMIYHILGKYRCHDKSDYNQVDIQHQYEYENLSFNIYPESVWERKCKNLSIDALECAFLDDNFIYKEAKKYIDTNNIDKIQLRKSISAVVSNSWVKAKKKFIDGEERIGYKSLFHALRILTYGIQIYKFGKINNYEEATLKYYPLIKGRYIRYKEKYTKLELYNSILNDPIFKDLDNFKLIFNKLKTEFKAYTENEWRSLKKKENDLLLKLKGLIIDNPNIFSNNSELYISSIVKKILNNTNLLRFNTLSIDASLCDRCLFLYAEDKETKLFFNIFFDYEHVECLIKILKYNEKIIIDDDFDISIFKLNSLLN